MGFEFGVHVGIVVKCDFPKAKVVNHSKRYCGECNHGSKKGLEKSTKFCPACGTELVTEKFTENKIRSFWEVLRETDVNEDLFYWIDAEQSKNTHYLGVNIRGRKYGQIVSEGGNSAFVLDPIKMQEVLEEFKKEYGQMVDLLRPFYEKVSINYMAKSDYS